MWRMPGRCVEKEAAAEGRRPLVVIGGYSAIADVDGDGKNEYVVGDYGIHVLKSDGSLALGVRRKQPLRIRPA